MSLQYAILAALTSKPKTGYELSSKIEGSIAYFWNASHQQIYKELKSLDSAGWVSARDVSQTEKPDKKVYRMTSLGLKELKAWIAEEAETPPAKDALLIKIFAGHLVPARILIEVLNKSRAQRMARLKRYEEIERTYFSSPSSLPDDLRFQHLTLRRGIIFEKAWLNWCDETREYLKSRIH